MMLSTLSKKVILALIIMACSSDLYAFSQEQIKAVFLEKFTHLIEWPDNSNEEFVICVLNDENFARTLSRLYSVKTFKAKKVNVISLSQRDPVPFCKLLFIGKSTKNIDNINAKLDDKPVLTVSDHSEITSQNVMITISFEQNRFNYTINNKVAKKANIKISHLLLNSAKEVIK